VVLDIERQNAMPTLGIPRDSHLWSGMRGVSNLVSWWAAKVHIFSNEAPEVCPDLEKGGHKRKKRRPPAFSGRSTVLCVAGFHLQRSIRTGGPTRPFVAPVWDAV
jgi:hypothetical protein